MPSESKILELFEQVEMNKKITPPYRKLLRNFIARKEQYTKQLNEEQRKGLEEILSISGSLDEQEMREYFSEGFKMATRLMTEALSK